MEIFDYLWYCVDKYCLCEKICFYCEVEEVCFDVGSGEW